jgi:hypothetical protein
MKWGKRRCGSRTNGHGLVDGLHGLDEGGHVGGARELEGLHHRVVDGIVHDGVHVLSVSLDRSISEQQEASSVSDAAQTPFGDKGEERELETYGMS